MDIHGVELDDTFAEAFDMTATRLVITAHDANWARHAATSMTGFATSVIGCGVEAGIEGPVAAERAPDGRPALAVLLFAFDRDTLAKHIERRVGQCVLTAPTTAVFAGLEGEPVNLGRNLRFFGDGYQISKVIGDTRYWRVPVMDGEFLCQERTGAVRAVGGGNFLVLAASLEGALAACERAVAAIGELPNVITPFPGGVVRSGSKIGSKYSQVPASTNHLYCPTLRGLTETRLGPEIGAVLEIVINGLTHADITRAMRAGIEAACSADANVRRISAGNFGGELGKHHFHLREIMA